MKKINNTEELDNLSNYTQNTTNSAINYLDSKSTINAKAAQRTIPYYTKVTVQSLENLNKSSHVYILDRGPYVGGVILDFNGKVTKLIVNINTISMDTISFSKSGNSIILGVQGLVENEAGFYKLNLNNN